LSWPWKKEERMALVNDLEAGIEFGDRKLKQNLKKVKEKLGQEVEMAKVVKKAHDGQVAMWDKKVSDLSKDLDDLSKVSDNWHKLSEDLR